MAKTQSVAVQMANILEEYEERVADVASNAIQNTAKESVQKLKATSPKRPGHGEYARGWKLKKERGLGKIDTVIVHNTQYQLTHLLENGHVIRNGKGTYGRVNGIKHIKPVEEWANEELPNEIERELE